MLTGLLQPTHLVLLLGIMLIVLGPKRLPGAGRAIGQGLKELKGSLDGKGDSTEAAAHVPAGETPAPPAAPH